MSRNCYVHPPQNAASVLAAEWPGKNWTYTGNLGQRRRTVRSLPRCGMALPAAIPRSHRIRGQLCEHMKLASEETARRRQQAMIVQDRTGYENHADRTEAWSDCMADK